ncbi:NAD(P)/FAD-dependent oxidoreductase [Nocardioides bizhenqiangii]|uniref:FAD-dependent monooxygenase n=1 Tax=Nocardioides bizhenqiangii TaxID=3095076 RepID=A0ABZ0ZRE4_9ACTN|nr:MULTISPECIES: FAD-dependent monooxygenase [unclassified Nocardioides]MDZ5619648.1 FAD-dependent monooxygenase [Nocardioides sp. HM23]WQQ26341.1 FAD-dependent monooxygenase [Nocardioides sp. HM61]
MTSYDVVVVGARAAGAATARLLATAGLSVLLVDRSRYGADTLSTHALMRGGVLQLHRWGLLDEVVAVGTPPIRQVTFRYDGQVVPVTIKPSHGVDALYAPRRTVLDPILADAARVAGADVRYGVVVTDVERSRDGVVTGVIGRSGDRGFRVGARIVVGADGLRSTIAEAVGARAERMGVSTGATTYGYWPDLDIAGYQWNFRPDAASGVIPTNDGLTCVFASATAPRIGRGGAAPLLRIVAETDPDLADLLGAVPAPPMRTFTGQRSYLRRAWGPGWALVGDAGYFKDPLSAHGLTDALRDAELLARAIVGTLRDGRDGQEMLAGYQATRDALSDPLFEAVDTIAGHRWADRDIGGLLMRINAAMADEVEMLAGLADLAFVTSP